MKPQQPNVEYCIEHKDWINGLLDKRGGWERGDRYTYAEYLEEERIDIWHLAHQPGDPRHGAIWLPSEGDVLAMLECPDHSDAMDIELMRRKRGLRLAWTARAHLIVFPTLVDPGAPTEIVESQPQATPLIALLELLRAVEGDDGL